VRFRFRDLILTVIPEFRLRLTPGVAQAGGCGCSRACTYGCSMECSACSDITVCHTTDLDSDLRHKVYPGELELIREKLQLAIRQVDDRIEELVEAGARERGAIAAVIGEAFSSPRSASDSEKRAAMLFRFRDLFIAVSPRTQVGEKLAGDCGCTYKCTGACSDMGTRPCLVSVTDDIKGYMDRVILPEDILVLRQQLAAAHDRLEVRRAALYAASDESRAATEKLLAEAAEEFRQG